MLNELDSLTQNINRLLQTLENSRGALTERDAQLARVRVERDEALTTNHALRAERDTLRGERDALLAKIEDAQVKLNAILEKLPPPRNAAVAEDPSEASDADAEVGQVGETPSAHDEHTQSVPHAEGETYER